VHFLTCGSEEDVAEEDDSSLSLLAGLSGIYIGIDVSDREAAVFLDLNDVYRYLRFVIRIGCPFRSQLGLTGR
jgi:hypothetical protein